SEVIAPPSKAATTSRPSTSVKSNKFVLQSIVIGAPLESAESLCRKRTFADSAPRCIFLCEISGLALDVRLRLAAPQQPAAIHTKVPCRSPMQFAEAASRPRTIGQSERRG